MTSLHVSPHYMWCTTDVLGKGATSTVYQGKSRENGEAVAVKIFNQMCDTNAQVRELRVLKKLKHLNVVKLLAIEEERGCGGAVIVMELCAGGSLFDVLGEPENAHGLRETEFLLVLEHLTAGIKHLRDNNLVHRDLKPGNIMRFIADDGSSIYKLIDFGTARELKDDQEFTSPYGTEEYLRPDLYTQAVFRKGRSKTFDATVDLWSIGATLYHVAAGKLPFRPFGGRKNRDLMLFMTSKKRSGVISAVQANENGPIEWRSELPPRCLLSGGLRKFVTPLLAGLLEAEPKKFWTFDQFFGAVANVVSRKPINVFHVNRASLIKVYLHPHENYEHLQASLREQTRIGGENQILLRKEGVFRDLIGEKSRAESYPATSEQEPLVLFSKANHNVEVDAARTSPTFRECVPDLSYPVYDGKKAKSACDLAYVFQRHIENTALHSALIRYSVENFALHLTNQLAKLQKLCQDLTRTCESHKELAQAMYLGRKATAVLSNESAANIVDRSENLLEISEHFFEDVKPRVQELYEKNVDHDQLKVKWQSATGRLKCPARTKAPEMGRTEVKRLRDSVKVLLRSCAGEISTRYEQQFQNLERVKIMDNFVRIEGLQQYGVVAVYERFADNLGDWCKVAQTVYVQTAILNEDTRSYQKTLKEFHDKLMLENVQAKEDMQWIIEQKGGIPCFLSPVAPSARQNDSYRTERLQLRFSSLVTTKDEVQEAASDNEQEFSTVSTNVMSSCKHEV